MIRLGIVAEGETEEGFINKVLAEHLAERGVSATTVVLGGNVSVERLAGRMTILYYSFDFVTSLVDFYRFRNRPTNEVEVLENRILETVSRRVGSQFDNRKIIPYVQLHEFEALLFSDVSAFGGIPILPTAAIEQLTIIRSQVTTPEDIDDGPDTAPSKRIASIMPRYNKVLHGNEVAQAIGLETIRRECPRFNSWLANLETLAR